MANGNIEPAEPVPNIYPDKNPNPFSQPYSAPTPPPYYGEMPKSKNKTIIIIVGILFFIILFSIAGVIFYQTTAKSDPISLLPADASFYIRIKTNPENQQVKNFKELLNKFPYYSTISEKINEGLKLIMEQEPALKNFDLTISDELIISFVSKLDENMDVPPLVFIFPNPDLKKIDQMTKDFQTMIEKSGDWKIEKENYKGRTIVKAVPVIKPPSKAYPSYYRPPEPTTRPSMVLTNGHFFFSLKPEYLKKIIDVADDKKITNIFKKDKKESIVSGIAHKKIENYMPKDYLAFFYSEFDFAGFFKKSGNIIKKDDVNTFPFIASLASILDSLPFKGESAEESNKVVGAGAIIAKKDELQFESYSLDLREDAFLPSEFTIKDSLVNIIPEKIGDREIAFYVEGRNLENALDYVEKSLVARMTDEEKERFSESLETFEDSFGADLKKDILSLFKNNYAFFIASDSTGKNAPVASLVFELDNADKAKENLLKLKIPKIPNPIEESRFRAKDARVQSDMYQLGSMAEMIYDDKGSYANVRCSYKNTISYLDIQTICDDIKSQSGSQPIIHQSSGKYCAYTRLNEEGQYACLDNTNSSMRKTYINPAGAGYCTNATFLCPRNTGNIIDNPLMLERNSFLKEVVDGFEIYSLPVVDNEGLYFSIRDKNLILAFTKGQLIDILKSFADSSQIRLKDFDRFKEQFGGVPQNVISISYGFPYGFSGLIKYLTNFYINLAMSSSYEMDQKEMEIIVPAVNELLDKGITPYLKLLRSAGSYSYSVEKGLTIEKGKLIIKDLSPEEKKSTEEFWDNFRQWIEDLTYGPRSKAGDARIKSYLSQVRTIAEMIYDDSDYPSYENLCTESPAKNLNRNEEIFGSSLATIEDVIKAQQGGILNLVCLDSATSYCIVAGLASGGRYCIDSSGIAREILSTQNCPGTGTSQNPYKCPPLSNLP